MRFTRPGISEATLAAHFEYLCAKSGAQRLAYVPVVASGCEGSLVILYILTSRLLLDPMPSLFTIRLITISSDRMKLS